MVHLCSIILVGAILASPFSPPRSFVSKTGNQTRISVDVWRGNFIAVAEDTNCGRPEKHICLFQSGSEELADDSFVSTAFPAVAVDSTGKIYVVWSDASEIEPSTGRRTWDIYIRVKNPSGTWESSRRINGVNPQDACGMRGDQINPDIAVSNSGIFVVWQSIETNGRSFVCFAKSQDGRTWDSNKRLFEGYNPAVAAQGQEIYVAFSDINGNVFFAKSQDGGENFSVMANPLFRASRRLPDLSSPDISVTPSGNIVVVWQDKVLKDSGEDIDIFISISKDRGASWSQPEMLDLPGDQTNPSVTFLGGIQLFFAEKKSELMGFDIYYVEAQGEVIVRAGENSPSGTIMLDSGEVRIPVFQLKITTSPLLGGAEIKTLNVKISGSMNDPVHISRIQLWLDTDGNGIVSDGSDIQLGSAIPSQDDGTVSLPVNRSIVGSDPMYLLATVDLTKPIPRESTFKLRVDPPQDILVVVPGTSKGIAVSGNAIEGREIKVRNNLPSAILNANPSAVVEGYSGKITLDASNSSDPDGDTLSFSWEQIAGPTVSLITIGNRAEFTPPSSVAKNETLIFEVKVSDGMGGETSAQVSVIIYDLLNDPPVAIAKVRIGDNLFEPPIDVDEGSTVILDASESYDPNGDPLLFFWSGDVTVINPTRVTAYIIAPDVIGKSFESIRINLSVRDSKGAFSSDSIEIRVRNTKNDPPKAFFTYSPAKGVAPLDVEFDASPSFDIDGTIISYLWDFGDGSVLNTTSQSVSHRFERPGEYIVNLSVTDSGGASSSYSARVTALSSIPEIFIYAKQVTGQASFGVWQKIAVLRISNIGPEAVAIDNIHLSVSGFPDAHIDVSVDRDLDEVGESSSGVFSLSSTSQVFVVPLGITINSESSINLIISGNFSPISPIPVDYTLSLRSINARSTISSVEPVISGTSLPWIAKITVSKPAIVFASSITSLRIPGASGSFSINISAKGSSFVIKHIEFEYDPTKISGIHLFADKNGDGKQSQDEPIIKSLTQGEQIADELNISIAKGETFKLGLIVYPIKSTNYSLSPHISPHNISPSQLSSFPLNSSPNHLFSSLHHISFSQAKTTSRILHLLTSGFSSTLSELKYDSKSRLILILSLLVLIFLFYILRLRKFSMPFIFALILSLSAIYLSCANKSGKGPTTTTKMDKKQQDQQQQDQQQQVELKNRTVLIIKGVSISSPAEFDVVGIPIRITIEY